MKDVLIVSAHADDEILGMGGTLLKFSKLPKEYRLHWLIMTSIWHPKWSNDDINKRSVAIKRISEIIGFINLTKWNYKDNFLDTYPKNDIQENLISVLDNIQPNIIFTPSPWDFNFEHKLTFDLIEMSTKNYYSQYVEQIIAYEIPSSTDAAFKMHKNFPFNYYINIENEIDNKIELMMLYDSEIKAFPHPRSEKYIRSLSEVRGIESGFMHAEGFCKLKERVK